MTLVRLHIFRQFTLFAAIFNFSVATARITLSATARNNGDVSGTTDSSIAHLTPQSSAIIPTNTENAEIGSPVMSSPRNMKPKIRHRHIADDKASAYSNTAPQTSMLTYPSMVVDALKGDTAMATSTGIPASGQEDGKVSEKEIPTGEEKEAVRESEVGGEDRDDDQKKGGGGKGGGSKPRPIVCSGVGKVMVDIGLRTVVAVVVSWCVYFCGS